MVIVDSSCVVKMQIVEVINTVNNLIPRHYSLQDSNNKRKLRVNLPNFVSCKAITFVKNCSQNMVKIISRELVGTVFSL